MELTDAELDCLHSALYDEVYYGDDHIVYADPGADEYVDNLRSALGKLDDEIKRRERGR